MLHLNYVHLREIKTRRVKLVSEAGSVVLGSMVHLECVDQSKNTPKFYATFNSKYFQKKTCFYKTMVETQELRYCLGTPYGLCVVQVC